MHLKFRYQWRSPAQDFFYRQMTDNTDELTKNDKSCACALARSRLHTDVLAGIRCVQVPKTYVKLSRFQIHRHPISFILFEAIEYSIFLAAEEPINASARLVGFAAKYSGVLLL